MSGNSLDRFIAFCENQKPDRRYDYDSIECCAIAQWYRSEGRVCYSSNRLYESLACKTPHTFGALTERLKAYRKEYVA